MPVVHRRNNPRHHPDHDALVAEIERHLRAADNEQLPPEPRIVIEEARLTKNLRVYVLWRRWESVKETERSEIILDAYERVYGVPEMLRISVAMGLTPEDARELGMDLS